MQRNAALAVVALGAGAVALGRARAPRHALSRLLRRAAPRLATREQEPTREPWQCACGEGYLVAGRDRHRIYWLEQAAESEPLQADTCPVCDRALPSEHEVASGRTD